MRDCDVCHVTDDGPRHIHHDPATGDTIRHLDCCAKAGCPTGTCTPTTTKKG